MYRKNRSVFSLVLALVFSLFLFSACSSAPVQEMSDARQAIQAANEAGADKLARMIYQDARNYLNKAETHLEKGEYGQARESALAAKKKAIDAREKAIKTQN